MKLTGITFRGGFKVVSQERALASTTETGGEREDVN